MSYPTANFNINGLEKLLEKYAEDFASQNYTAKVILRGLTLVGIGLRPVLDHFLFRTRNPQERLKEFLELGYAEVPSKKIIGVHKDPIRVYVCCCLPAILMEEAKTAGAKEWVKVFGDHLPFMMGVRVDNLENATFHLEKQAVRFLRPGIGKPGEDIRSIASVPVFQDGRAMNVLVLTERHAGNTSYYAPDFWNKA